jgi:hypothetical protein
MISNWDISIGGGNIGGLKGAMTMLLGLNYLKTLANFNKFATKNVMCPRLKCPFYITSYAQQRSLYCKSTPKIYDYEDG